MCANRMPRTYAAYIPYKEMRIPKEVRKAVDKMKPSGGGQIHWLCYFQEYEGELLARIFAAQKTKARGTELFEVMRETIGGTFYIQRNIYYEGMAGWRCWFPAENEIIPNDWSTIPVDKMPGVWIEIINTEAIYTVEKFKYCGYTGGFPAAPYLRMYLEEPGIEFFGKKQLRPTKTLVAKAKKDPNFRKWIRKLTPEEVHRANIYGPAAVLEAYKRKTTNFRIVASDLEDKRRHHREVNAYGARAAVKKGKWSPERVLEYIGSGGSGYAYGDYIQACDYLQLDLKDTKVAFPKDFRRMHDLRIDQMNSRKAAEDKKKRAELYAQFRAVAETVKPYECIAEGFAIVIPLDPSELIREGTVLQHCVGKMGYDKKEAERRSFIAFLRRADDIKTPFVTIEFGFKTKTVLQCYGAKDSNPGTMIRAFVDRWAETVKKALLEQERAAAAAAEEEESAAAAATA